MIRFAFALPRYDWHVRVFMPVRSLNIPEIMATLNSIGTTNVNLRSAYELLARDEFNAGLTLSNGEKRRSAMVVGAASSAEEFYDTLQHEQTHLAMHIAEAFGIDEHSEEFAYLIGDISRIIFPYASRFLCDHCRKT